MLAGIKKIHFVGIGGVGMSGLAQILLKAGYRITGSDIKSSEITERLSLQGAIVSIGHKESNVGDAELVVYSSAIMLDNPELIFAHSKNIPIIKRAELLAELMEGKIGIAVTGAHGKTTTTSLISVVLTEAGLAPTVAIGGIVYYFNGNVSLGNGQYFIAEADESDGSFLCYSPTYSVVTNIDLEHLDFYRDLKDIKESFMKFINRTKEEGCLFCSGDDLNLRDILSGYKNRFITFGLSNACDIYPKNIHSDGFSSSFDCVYKGSRLGRLNLRIPGKHNISNSLSAVGVALELGINFSKLQTSLSSYCGAERRFQLKGEVNGIMVIDDYAHHPTEIKATLEAAKIWKDKRIVAVFQPHRYTRTKYLLDTFSNTFNLVDHLVITDIYPASEKPIEGVSARNIYTKIVEYGHKDVHFLPKGEIVEHLVKRLKPNDLVIIMGAGDIGKVANELVNTLMRKSAFQKQDKI
jgi:UDP-N-acetylmuramate--alanine ligase